MHDLSLEDDLEWNPWGLELEDARRADPEFRYPGVPALKLKDDEGSQEIFHVPPRRGTKLKTSKNPNKQHTVEIWGKAAIGKCLDCFFSFRSQ